MSLIGLQFLGLIGCSSDDKQIETAKTAEYTYASDVTRIEIPVSDAIMPDGILAIGEWDNAARLPIALDSAHTVDLLFSHDGSHLQFAFTPLSWDGQEFYPELLIDINSDGDSLWGADHFWFHASYQDCDGVGEYDQWKCAVIRNGWTANNFPLSEPGLVEIRVSFEKLGLERNRTASIGLAVALRDREGVRYYWPAGSSIDLPASWGNAALSGL